MPLFDTYFTTRRRLKLGLTIAGAVAGAVFGIVLTRFGKIVTDAPPATTANYLWNAAVFAAVAGVVSPIVSWTSLRRAPVWRTIVEPLAFAIAGGTVAVIVAVPVLVVVLPPVGLVLGFAHLQRRYPEPRQRIADRTTREIAD